MRSVLPVWVAKISNLAVAACLIVFGIFVVIKPGCSDTAVRFVIGSILVLNGICKLIGYFCKDLYRLAFQYDLPLGIVFIIFGGIVLIRPEEVTQTVCILFSTAVLIESIYKIMTSFDAKKFGIKWWLLLFILALFACIFGIGLLCCPVEYSKERIILMGITCIGDGFLNFIEKSCTVKIVKNQIPDGAE